MQCDFVSENDGLLMLYALSVLDRPVDCLFFISVPADLLAALGLSVTLAFAATAPYAAIVIGRRVLGRKKSSRWVT